MDGITDVIRDLISVRSFFLAFGERDQARKVQRGIDTINKLTDELDDPATERINDELRRMYE